MCNDVIILFNLFVDERRFCHRELALQIKQQFCAFGASVGVRCVTIIGGVDSVQQALDVIVL
jgi:hypothetical protein